MAKGPVRIVGVRPMLRHHLTPSIGLPRDALGDVAAHVPAVSFPAKVSCGGTALSGLDGATDPNLGGTRGR